LINWFDLWSVINQSINQSKHISIAPYVASESEAHKFVHCCLVLICTKSGSVFRIIYLDDEQPYWLAWPAIVIMSGRTYDLQRLISLSLSLSLSLVIYVFAHGATIIHINAE